METMLLLIRMNKQFKIKILSTYNKVNQNNLLTFIRKINKLLNFLRLSWDPHWIMYTNRNIKPILIIKCKTNRNKLIDSWKDSLL